MSDSGKNSGAAIEELRLRLLSSAAEMMVRPEDINAAVDLVVQQFGVEWVARELRRPVPDPFHTTDDFPSLIREHGVYPGVEFLEACCYIAALREADARNVTKGIRAFTNDRSGQFRSEIFRLAMHFRFSLLDVSHLQIEPEAVGGRAGDISLVADGSAFMVECFRPAEKQYVHPELEYLLSQLVQSLSEFAAPFAVFVSAHSVPKGHERKALVKKVCAWAKAAATRRESDTGAGPDLLFCPFAVASVYCAPDSQIQLGVQGDVHPELPPRGTSYQQLLAQRRVGQNGPVLASSRVLVGVSGPEPRQPGAGNVEASIMARASIIEKKLAQARSVTGASRIMLVEDFFLYHDLVAAPEKVIRRFTGKLLDAHDGVAAIGVLSRRALEHVPRYTYDARFFVTGSSEAAQRLLAGFEAQEVSLFVPTLAPVGG